MYLLCAQCFQRCVAGSSVGSSIITKMCVFAVCARHFQRCVAGSSVSSSIITRMCVFAVRAQRFQRCVAGSSVSSSMITIICVGCVCATFSALHCWQQCGQQHNYQNVYLLCMRNVFSAALLAGSLSSSIITRMCVFAVRAHVFSAALLAAVWAAA